MEEKRGRSARGSNRTAQSSPLARESGWQTKPQKSRRANRQADTHRTICGASRPYNFPPHGRGLRLRHAVPCSTSTSTGISTARIHLLLDRGVCSRFACKWVALVKWSGKPIAEAQSRHHIRVGRGTAPSAGCFPLLIRACCNLGIPKERLFLAQYSKH